jgi:hypothetical protein
VVGPRVFGIAATDAPVVAVLRRGPSSWCSLGRWDVDAGRYETGSWLHGTVYPQRCDVSPDGRWLAAFVMKQQADWVAGTTYVSISRLPWLTALAAWGIGSTWTSGVHFLRDTTAWLGTDPDVGDPAPCRRRYGLGWTRAASFAVERRRGWTESSSTPPRDPQDMWDQRREVTMVKPSPRAPATTLAVCGWHAAWRSFEPERFGPSAYWLERNGVRQDLPDVQWADWAADGRLLVATTQGRLQARAPDGVSVDWEHDLAAEEPVRTPPPAEASRW